MAEFLPLIDFEEIDEPAPTAATTPPTEPGTELGQATPDPTELATRPNDVQRLIAALWYTAEYADLPPRPGWAWWDTLTQIAPDVATQYREQYQRLHPEPDDSCHQVGASESGDAPGAARDGAADLRDAIARAAGLATDRGHFATRPWRIGQAWGSKPGADLVTLAEQGTGEPDEQGRRRDDRLIGAVSPADARVILAAVNERRGLREWLAGERDKAEAAGEKDAATAYTRALMWVASEEARNG